MAENIDTIPVMRPLLPLAEKILPYLRRIDGSRNYSNFGPLASEFEFRLSRLFNVAPEATILAASGTSALMGAILAGARLDGGQRFLAMMPSFTFVATAVAAERCGLKPYLIDVDSETWALEPSRLLEHPALDRVAILIPVAPFGRALPQVEWLEFQARTGIPVVLDNAAAFATAKLNPNEYLGALPSIFSFHATKSFGVGEGGCVVCTDLMKVQAIAASLNFGFRGTRDSAAPSLNGKLNEYSAAVGLAALDDSDNTYRTIRETSARYRSHFEACGLSDRFVGCPDIDGSYALFKGKSESEIIWLTRRLDERKIDYRFWYGRGIHHQRHFASVARDPLPVTESLGCLLMGIPMAPDLSEKVMVRVVAACASDLAEENGVASAKRVRKELI